MTSFFFFLRRSSDIEAQDPFYCSTALQSVLTTDPANDAALSTEQPSGRTTIWTVAKLAVDSEMER